MFTEFELDGVQSPRLEEWLNEHEAEIRAAATIPDPYDYKARDIITHYVDGILLEKILDLLKALWDAK